MGGATQDPAGRKERKGREETERAQAMPEFFRETVAVEVIDGVRTVKKRKASLEQLRHLANT